VIKDFKECARVWGGGIKVAGTDVHRGVWVAGRLCCCRGSGVGGRGLGELGGLGGLGGLGCVGWGARQGGVCGRVAWQGSGKTSQAESGEGEGSD